MVSVSTKPKGLTRSMLKNLPLSKILLSLAAVSVLAVAAVGGTFANFTASPTAIASNGFAWSYPPALVALLGPRESGLAPAAENEAAEGEP